jgi:hypothetical protein
VMKRSVATPAVSSFPFELVVAQQATGMPPCFP